VATEWGTIDIRIRFTAEAENKLRDRAQTANCSIPSIIRDIVYGDLGLPAPPHNTKENAASTFIGQQRKQFYRDRAKRK
jgi:hypothetical protein